MSIQKKILLTSLITILFAILFPPWGWSSDPFRDTTYGFLFSGPFSPESTSVTYAINWHILLAEILVIIVIGLIFYIFSKK